MYTVSGFSCSATPISISWDVQGSTEAPANIDNKQPEQLNKSIHNIYPSIIIIYIIFNEYKEMTNYMTYDSSSLNQYNYAN